MTERMDSQLRKEMEDLLLRIMCEANSETTKQLNENPDSYTPKYDKNHVLGRMSKFDQLSMEIAARKLKQLDPETFQNIERFQKEQEPERLEMDKQLDELIRRRRNREANGKGFGNKEKDIEKRVENLHLR